MKTGQLLPYRAEHDLHMQVILDHTLEAFILADLSGVIQAFNKKAEQYIFKNMQDRVHKGALIYDYMTQQRGLAFRELLVRVANGETIEYERRYDEIEGRSIWFEFSLSPVFEGSQVTAVCIKGREVTGIKEAQMLSNSLFNDGPVAMFVSEKVTLKYLQINEAAINHYQYSREEFLTMTAFDIRVKEEHASLMAVVERGANVWNRNIVGCHRKKNGELLNVQVALHDIEYQGLEAILIVVTDVTEFVALQKRVINEKLSKQRLITRATIRAQEKERSTIGGELHDNINQMLASTKLFLNCALQHPENQEQLVTKSIDTIQQSIDEIRRLSHQLVPPLLGDLGLSQAIKELAGAMGFNKSMFKATGLKVFSEINLCDELKLCVYRIFQENFSNVAKYAEASKITVTVSMDDNMLLIKIMDNGKGFDTKAQRKGIGLTNICNRVSSFDGKMDILSAPGKGTTMFVKFQLARMALSKSA